MDRLGVISILTECRLSLLKPSFQARAGNDHLALSVFHCFCDWLSSTSLSLQLLQKPSLLYLTLDASCVDATIPQNSGGNVDFSTSPPGVIFHRICDQVLVASESWVVDLVFWSRWVNSELAWRVIRRECASDCLSDYLTLCSSNWWRLWFHPQTPSFQRQVNFCYLRQCVLQHNAHMHATPFQTWETGGGEAPVTHLSNSPIRWCSKYLRSTHRICQGKQNKCVDQTDTTGRLTRTKCFVRLKINVNLFSPARGQTQLQTTTTIFDVNQIGGCTHVILRFGAFKQWATESYQCCAHW